VVCLMLMEWSCWDTKHEKILASAHPKHGIK
jgi:hypothetical protein